MITDHHSIYRYMEGRDVHVNINDVLGYQVQSLFGKRRWSSMSSRGVWLIACYYPLRTSQVFVDVSRTVAAGVSMESKSISESSESEPELPPFSATAARPVFSSFDV